MVWYGEALSMFWYGVVQLLLWCEAIDRSDGMVFYGIIWYGMVKLCVCFGMV